MATLSGFTRPSDPLDAVGLAATISTAISKTVTVEITSTDVLVTGTTLVSGDQGATQTAITSYYYPNTQIGVPIVDNPNMSSARHNKAISEYAAYNADVTVAGQANKVQSSGSTIAVGAWAILRKATTNSSGVATIYLTTDGTSGTAAAFTTVYEDGIIAMAIGSDNYQVTSCVLSGDNKSVAITLNKISSVLGVLTLGPTAGAGVEVRTTVWGK